MQKHKKHESSSGSSGNSPPNTVTPYRPITLHQPQLNAQVPQTHLSTPYPNSTSHLCKAEATLLMNSIPGVQDDGGHSIDEEEWPEPDSDTESWMALVQRRKCFIGAASGKYMSHCLSSRLIPSPLVSGKTVQFIMSQYESLFEHMSFKPPLARVKSMRGKFISRIISSDLIHWSMYLGAKIFQSLKQNGDYTSIRGYAPWLDRCHRLCITSRNDNNFEDFTSRFSGALELIFLKYLASDANSGYNFMRLIAPTFMYIAYADPSLWPRHPSSNGVSLAHVLSSHQYELSRFVFIDMVTSLTFGVPPLVEYDTSHPVIRTREAHALEWVHGCPVEFVFSIVRVSTWRAQNSKGTIGPDGIWEEIEADTWAWQSRGDYGPDHESSKIVARFATQEGWRHAVLIYMYMGMCGVASHDPRVQASAQQISRLQRAMGPNLGVGLHSVIPLLLGAICIQSETQRSRLRKAIMEAGANKVWLLQSVQLASILDHLWHGAAANGAAVTWEDYVDSRRAVVRIDVL